MAIVKLDSLNTIPTLNDWAILNNLVHKIYAVLNKPVYFYDDIVPSNTIINFRNTLYYVTEDYSISGVKSNYIKFEEASAIELSVSYVETITGITWNTTYCGYYDSSNNLYIFDELMALLNDIITVAHTIEGRLYNIANQKLLTTSDVMFNSITAIFKEPLFKFYGAFIRFADIYNALAPFMQNIGDKCFVTGFAVASYSIYIAYAERTTEANIVLHGYSEQYDLIQLVLASNSATDIRCILFGGIKII